MSFQPLAYEFIKKCAGDVERLNQFSGWIFLRDCHFCWTLNIQTAAIQRSDLTPEVYLGQRTSLTETLCWLMHIDKLCDDSMRRVCGKILHTSTLIQKISGCLKKLIEIILHEHSIASVISCGGRKVSAYGQFLFVNLGTLPKGERWCSLVSGRRWGPLRNSERVLLSYLATLV